VDYFVFMEFEPQILCISHDLNSHMHSLVLKRHREMSSWVRATGP
jgi:hypothetical protein